MVKFRFLILFFILFTIGCKPGPSSQNISNKTKPAHSIKGAALLATRFSSLEDLKKVVQIDYSGKIKPQVRLTHKSNGDRVISVLKTGINETDITDARDGDFWDRVWLSLSSPYFVMHRKDLLRAFILSRRRHKIFGGGDVAFYDLAETMVHHISKEDLANIPSKDLSEKGYINTFNHVTAQAFMTSIFSEQFADFIADTHERTNMPELVTGKFSENQLIDVDNNPVDNYVDIINNEWGQELGKLLSNKYSIAETTYWTPALLADYLNDLQAYYSWVFQIGFEPFTTSDEVVTRFSDKINSVMEGVSGLR